MSWLFEDPTTLIVAGVLIEGLLAVGLVKSGRGILAVPMLVVALIFGLGVLVERLVVTDREQIEDVFHGVCRALQANDVDGVLDYIDPAATGMRGQVRNVISAAHITDARIYDLEVEVDRQARPPVARAQLTGRVKGNYRGEAASGEGMVLRRFTVDFRLVNGHWLMTTYEDRGPLGRGDEDRRLP